MTDGGRPGMACVTAGPVLAAATVLQLGLALPFELLRAGHAQAVRLGLAPRSLLQQRELARGLHALEQLTLGPWARRV